ncbi:hypothetical protein OHS33_21460 [Streptomyces sp. NBC_00536]|uniref:hypothetical protein n=1 Tax=Streptomyces sp. NBC_00536 TaxID=2975769 RepID=UPI002E821C94|nr:hypothetical protein [Streptomyces sp. NBC_00536]WUC80661.1 hypothetical protein OHS33_21460 [Streptomyces sp. NBC_00536]
MNVLIQRVWESQDGRHLVHFASQAGHAWGVWGGDDVPRAGTENVEVDIPDAVRSWSSTDKPDSLIGEPGASLTICGMVESFHEGVAAILISSAVLLVEIEGASPRPGQRITFSVPEVHLFPYSL